MLKKINILIMITFFSLQHCSKDIAITQFKDDYSYYEEECRIEAIVNTTNLAKSIVRIDKTLLITNTDLFDGLDNDNDWQGYEDLNGNGQWDKNEPLNDDTGSGTNEKGKGNGKPDAGEPHVDEIDEILPNLHDSTYTIQLFNKTDNMLVADFEWSKNADHFKHVINENSDQEESVTYGGYIPSEIYLDSFDYSKEYEFIIHKETEEIFGKFTASRPVEFLLDNHTMVEDTVMIYRNTNDHIYWHSGPNATVFWCLVERLHTDGTKEIIESNPFSAVAQADDGGWLCMEFSSEHAPGLYQLTVFVPSRDYGHYFYSQLPIHDEKLNNLRNQNDEVVLGIAGALSEAKVYFRVKE